MKKIKVLNKTGFSLVELLIYIGLLAILMTILSRIFTGIIDVQLSSEATGAVEEDGRFIYARMAYDIGRAQSVVSPVNLGDVADTLILQIDGVTNTYNVSSNNLVLTNAYGSSQLNSVGSVISNLSFQRLGNVNGKDSILVTYTVTSTTVNIRGADTKTIETTIALR